MKHRRGLVASICALTLAVSIVAINAPIAGAANKKPAYDPNGVIKRPIDMTTNGGISFDPANVGTGEYVYSYPLVAGLLLRNKDLTYSPWLAEKVTTPDTSTIVVNLRKGLVFSNGETLDATAAVNSIKRTAAAKAPGLRVAEMGYLADATVNNPTQFTIKLNCACIGAYYPLLADMETVPIAPASIAANTKTSKTVIAAGAFKIDSYTPGVGVKFVKNDKYYDAKNVKLAGWELVHVASGVGNITNALRANAVDLASGAQVGAADVGSLTTPITVVQHKIDAAYWINMCMKDGTPLGNVKVRQALNYATDRNEINQKLYNGASSPAWTLFPPNSPQGDKTLENHYKYNPAKAKKLLAEAGYSNGLELTVITAAAGDPATIDQIVQAQWAKVGVKTTLKVSNNLVADWYGTPTGQVNTVQMTREGAQRLTRLVTSNAFANVCKYPVPTIDSLSTQLNALDINDPAVPKLWKQVDQAFTKELADGVTTVWVVQNIAFNSSKIGGMTYQTDAIEQWQPDFAKIYVKKNA
jgi:ABC-type transport system substrate-binding protein